MLCFCFTLGTNVLVIEKRKDRNQCLFGLKGLQKQNFRSKLNIWFTIYVIFCVLSICEKVKVGVAKNRGRPGIFLNLEFIL